MKRSSTDAAAPYQKRTRLIHCPPSPLSPNDVAHEPNSIQHVGIVQDVTSLTPPNDNDTASSFRPYSNSVSSQPEDADEPPPFSDTQDSWQSNSISGVFKPGAGSQQKVDTKSSSQDDIEGIFAQGHACDTATSIFPMDMEVDLEAHVTVSADFQSLESEDDEVCFGMVKDTSLADLQLPELPAVRMHAFDLQLDDNGTVCMPQTNFVIGTIAGATLEALRKLQQEEGISLQLRCMVQKIKGSQLRNSQNGKPDQTCFSLFCNIYGPFRMFDQVGDFLERYDIVLQDPQGCDRNVRYRNPHRLNGRDPDAPMTIDRFLDTSDVVERDWRSSSNYLDDLELIDHRNLPLAQIPTALTTKLFGHQRRALFFMQAREHGWNFTGEQPDIWKIKQIHGHPMSLNTINDDLQFERPPDFKGGLLADEMGLGKTVEILSLIASDQDQPIRNLDHRGPGLTQASGYQQPHPTLVIVPRPLISVWEEQLQTHCDTQRMRWFRHHGKHKLQYAGELSNYNIVLTTYDTISGEWKRRHSKASILYSTQWHRIVLDEAHFIRTQGTRREEAILGLQARRRWAVTGTPIQNHLNDFVSLLQFLRVHPYDNPSNFDQDIVKMWKDDPLAASARAKRLISCIAIRRTSHTIDLPPRDDQIRQLQFSKAERQVYEPLERQLRGIFGDTDEAGAGTYQNALHGLHVLRTICNFGVLADPKALHAQTADSSAWDSHRAQVMFDGLQIAGMTHCTRCRNDVIWNEEHMSDVTSQDMDAVKDVRISHCAKILCSTCTQKRQRVSGNDQPFCGHETSCISFPVSASRSVAGLAPEMALTSDNRPTKIKYLIQDICMHRRSKSVVFSQWRVTLNLAANALKAAGIRFVRYDGKISPNERELALNQFKEDPEIRVILFTIQCGAVGLNLTAADRAYLMEPQWNPTVEEQALARVHRMGQTKPVTTIRFIIADTYEQRIAAIQQRKKNFIDLLLSNKGASSRNGESGRFAHLRSLLT